MAFQLDNIRESRISKPKNEVRTSILEKEIIVLKKPFSNKTKEDFYTELSVLLKAGINLREALDLLKDSQRNTKTKSIINDMVNRIVSGDSLSKAMQSFKCFTKYEFHSIKIGEETGTLTKITEQLGNFYNKKNEQRRQLINALTYPCIILTTAFFVVVFMLQFVVPMFEDIFKQQNMELPGITQFVVNVSSTLKNNSLLLLLLFVALIVSVLLLKEKLWYKKYKDVITSKIPIVGDFVKTVYLSQFTQALSLLTSTKVPIVKSVELVKEMMNYYPLNNALTIIIQQLLKGESLSISLSEHKLFDPKMVALIKVAEETNETEFMFDRLNYQYNSKVEQRSKMLSTVLEPIIILFVGLFVGFILIAMYLPMFKLSSILG